MVALSWGYPTTPGPQSLAYLELSVEINQHMIGTGIARCWPAAGHGTQSDNDPSTNLVGRAKTVPLTLRDPSYGQFPSPRNWFPHLSRSASHSLASISHLQPSLTPRTSHSVC